MRKRKKLNAMAKELKPRYDPGKRRQKYLQKKVNPADIIIDPEFKGLLLPLTREELDTLERSLLQVGCQDPLILWNKIIVDGHNRLHLCKKNNLPFEIRQENFNSREEVKLYILEKQLGRRNINAYQRSTLALKIKNAMIVIAKKRQGYKKRKIQVYQNSDKPEPVHVNKKLARMAKVSHDTLARVDKINQKCDQETKDKLTRGEISINQAYEKLQLHKSPDEYFSELQLNFYKTIKDMVEEFATSCGTDANKEIRTLIKYLKLGKCYNLLEKANETILQT